MDSEPRGEIVQFASDEEFVAWAREHVQDWRRFLEDSEASRRALVEWRAAGHTTFAPGTISLRDFLREHPL